MGGCDRKHLGTLWNKGNFEPEIDRFKQKVDGS